jgi:hypothetical protein
VVVAEWLTDFLPSGVQTLLTPHVLLVFTIFGIASFVASVVGVPLFLARIPADYFSGRELRARGIPKPERSALQILLLILRNLLGALLVVCGILALVLPGQGVLTILVGVLLMNFPGKRRFERVRSIRKCSARSFVMSASNRSAIVASTLERNRCIFVTTSLRGVTAAEQFAINRSRDSWRPPPPCVIHNNPAK